MAAERRRVPCGWQPRSVAGPAQAVSHVQGEQRVSPLRGAGMDGAVSVSYEVTNVKAPFLLALLIMLAPTLSCFVADAEQPGPGCLVPRGPTRPKNGFGSGDGREGAKCATHRDCGAEYVCWLGRMCVPGKSLGQLCFTTDDCLAGLVCRASGLVNYCTIPVDPRAISQ